MGFNSGFKGLISVVKVWCYFSCYSGGLHATQADFTDNIHTNSRYCTMFCVGNCTFCDNDASKKEHRHLPSTGM